MVSRNKKIGLLGVPLGFGAAQIGSELGVNAIRHSRIRGRTLVEHIADLGYQVIDHGDAEIVRPTERAKPDDNPDLSTKGAQAAAGRRCASCHTDTYAGTKAVARVAGQREEYLLKALHDYKSGVRSGGGQAAMADVAYPLSAEEIEALAHYLAHL